MEEKSLWIAKHLLAPDAILPFSFEYGGQPSSAILKTWQKKTETHFIDDKRRQHILTWYAENSIDGLEVRCEAVEYLDFSAVEWTIYFKNNGSSNTPLIKNILGLDATFQKETPGEFILNGIKGDFCTADSYEPFMHELEPYSNRIFSPPSYSGKSSDGPDGWLTPEVGANPRARGTIQV